MKITWPPSEHGGWSIETHFQKEKQFLLPLFKHDKPLFAVRLRSSESQPTLQIEIPESKCFLLTLSQNTWTYLPFPIEQHAISSFWNSFHISSEEYELDLAYYTWKSPTYRMRALVSEDGDLFAAYRVNKNGETIAYFPPKDDSMKLPEDTYIIPPTEIINNKSILLSPAQHPIPIKKKVASRYFHIIENDICKYAKETE